MTDRELWKEIYRHLWAICFAIAKYKLGKSVQVVELQPTETDSVSVAFDTK